MPEIPCPEITSAKWWESTAIQSGIVSIVCGILLLCGFAVDADMKVKIETTIIIVLPAIGAIYTGYVQIKQRIENNRCKRDITRKLL